MGSLFDEIRDAAAIVMERAACIRIDDARLEALAALLADLPAAEAAADPAHQDLGSEESNLAYVVTLDAVNFGSGYFPWLRKRPGCSGYFTVAGALRDRILERGPLSAETLAALTPADCAELFGQQPAGPPIDEMMELFARSLGDLGRFLLERWDGSFAAMVRSAEGSAEALVRILSEMPGYRDVSLYQGLEVPFYKRAQITCADLAAAFGGEGLGSFRDLDRLTMFADNLVPHVLRVEGVLVYDASLLRRIEDGELIPAGSPEEIEIRAAAVHTVERICAVLGHLGSRLSAGQVDGLLWNRGQLPRLKSVPRHRTRCIYY